MLGSGPGVRVRVRVGVSVRARVGVIGLAPGAPTWRIGWSPGRCRS